LVRLAWSDGEIYAEVAVPLVTSWGVDDAGREGVPGLNEIITQAGLTSDWWIEYADVLVYGFYTEVYSAESEQLAIEHLTRRGYFAAGWESITPAWQSASHPLDPFSRRFELMRHIGNRGDFDSAAAAARWEGEED
jgi:hypothetical protein